MGVWRISTDTLAKSRFTVSALTETVGALGVLAGGPVRPDQRDWARAHRPAYRQRIVGDPVAAAFVAAALRPRWTADFVAVPPRPGDRTFHDELRQVRTTPPEKAYADLAVDGRLAEVLRIPDVAERGADLLEWVWTHTIRPDWPRRRRLLEADIVTRTQRLGAGGWAAALDGMRPGMRWLGDGTLRINTYDNPPRDIAGADLMFIPMTTASGMVVWDEPHRYAVVYPCAGFLADTGPMSPHPLARLLGAVRAGILVQLAEPRTTTQLVALTGFGLGSVGGHLTVLLGADLVQRRRAGRSVLYYRTALGDQLVGVGRR